jgi:hypothetical protein
LFVFVVSTKIERKKKGSDFLGFSDKLQTERERAVFFCLSFSGKKNKRVETDTGGEREREKAKKGKGKRRRRALKKAFCPPRHEFCQIFSRVLF